MSEEKWDVTVVVVRARDAGGEGVRECRRRAWLHPERKGDGEWWERRTRTRGKKW